MNKKELDALYNGAISHYDKREYEMALTKINEILKVDENYIPAQNAKASILIESWDGTIKNKSQIMEAISRLDIVIEKDPTNKKNYLKNKGNALYSLATRELKDSMNILNLNIVDNLEKARSCCRESLDIDENQPDVWINKGNALDHLGRHFEALECYDRAILLENKHYNAWGNRGIACWRLSKKAKHDDDRNKLLFESMHYLMIELTMHPDFQITSQEKELVTDFFTNNKIQFDLEKSIEAHMPKRKKYHRESFNLASKSPMGFQEFYYDFCDKHTLFLNLHFDCNKCDCSSLDLLQTGFIIPLKEAKKPYELFKRWFAIVDDYKAARALLVLAQFRPQELLFLDKQRYEPDYSLNYLVNVELLKEAFFKAVNICDKIAFFLNEYEELVKRDGKALTDKEISFCGSNSIFNQTEIIEKNNYQIDLVGMDSIRKDLEKGEMKILLQIRHYLAHRYFVLHDIVDVKNLTYPYDPSRTPLENIEYHMDINEFFVNTIKALQNIRNVLFSLSFFILEKEITKKNGAAGNIGELYWTLNWDDDKKGNKGR